MTTQNAVNNLPTQAGVSGTYTNANITVNSKGIITAAASGSGGHGLTGVQYFTASGTYTPTAGTNHIRVRLWGGGGGGGTTNSGSIGGPGGGGGAYVEGYLANSVSQTVTIGAGGSGGVKNNGTSATAGGDTSLGSLAVAKGGGLGQSSGGNPGAGGAAGSCTVPAGGIAISGETGGYINGLGALFSAGGGSFGSVGSSFPRNVVTVNGITNSGQGGQGGNNAQDGGAGAAGLMIIEEYT